ncbi:hypothetical protein BGZ73_004148 [Actinomortierella ambigua]|nr:hypothetical protein BGZ73_004148 [Actinomortierella ambigua]
MSTFDGVIREFPTLSIDNFVERAGVNVWLLSHVHEDHLSGLQSKRWNSPIYCSPITARLLPLLASRSSQIAFDSGHTQELKRKYGHLAPFLKPLANETPHYLDTGDGDCRNEIEDLIGLRQMPIFANASLAKTFDRLYLDTTCCHAAFHEFPPRQQVVGELVQFIDRRHRMAHYYIDIWTFGYEEIWVGLAQAFNAQVHVTAYLYELYGAIDEFLANKIQPHLTLDGRAARFHSCRLGPDCGYGAGLQQGSAVGREVIRIQPNVSWFSTLMQRERALGEPASPKAPVFEGKVTGRSTRFSIQERIPPSLSQRDPHFYYLNFACHSSLRELEQLVELVAPRALFPCVLHRDVGMRTFRESNLRVVALLARQVRNRTFALDVEENYAPERLRQWQIQQQQRRRGVLQDRRQALDPDDADGQSAHCSSRRARSSSLSKSGTESLQLAKSGPLLSPRSRHLLKNMQNLKRQLTRAKSEETDPHHKSRTSLDSGSGSSLGAGPLTLDMDELERKRLWWLQEDRGQSTTLEETSEEETDDSTQDPASSGHAGFRGSPDLQHKTPDREQTQLRTLQVDEWLEHSTVELSRTDIDDGVASSPLPPQQGQHQESAAIASNSGPQATSVVPSLSSSRGENSVNASFASPSLPVSLSVASLQSSGSSRPEHQQEHCIGPGESPVLPQQPDRFFDNSRNPPRHASSFTYVSSSARGISKRSNIFAHVALSPPRARSVASSTGRLKGNAHVTVSTCPAARLFAYPVRYGQHGWSSSRQTTGIKSEMDSIPSSSRSALGVNQKRKKKRHGQDSAQDPERRKTQEVDSQDAGTRATIWISSSDEEDETTTSDCGHVRASPGISAPASLRQEFESHTASASSSKVLSNDDDEERWLEYQDLCM